MAESHSIGIEIVYALPDKQRLDQFQVRLGTTVRSAVLSSGFQRFFPALDLHHCPLGIFGTVVSDDRVLADGDRIEIYRPLLKDPRDLRRDLAARGKSSGNKVS